MAFAMKKQIAADLVQFADPELHFSTGHSVQPGPSPQMPGPLPQSGTYTLRLREPVTFTTRLEVAKTPYG